MSNSLVCAYPIGALVLRTTSDMICSAVTMETAASGKFIVLIAAADPKHQPCSPSQVTLSLRLCCVHNCFTASQQKTFLGIIKFFPGLDCCQIHTALGRYTAYSEQVHVYV